MKLPFDLVTILTIAAIIIILFLLFKIFKILTRIILIVVFLVIAFLTNPRLEQHQHAAQKKAKAENIHLNERDVMVKDLAVASVTQIKQDQGTKTIGIGLFTRVFIFRDPE